VITRELISKAHHSGCVYHADFSRSRSDQLHAPIRWRPISVSP